MPDFNVRADSVNVEQIMEQIRARIREKRGVDYTEQQIRELAAVKLEKFLDPRGVRSDLLEQFRKAQPAYNPPELPNYAFEDQTIYESTRGPLRWLRKLLNPILKLFFNPNPLIQALHIQSRLNTMYGEREARREATRRAFDQLQYELMHNLVIETTRLSIEVKNLKMSVESLTGRLEFNERRARALESVVAYKPSAEERIEVPSAAPSAPREPGPVVPAGSTYRDPQSRPESHRPQNQQAAAQTPGQSPASAQPAQPGEGPGQRSRRRRRRRGRRGGGGSAQQLMGGQQQPQAQTLTGDAPSGASSSTSETENESAAGASLSSEHSSRPDFEPHSAEASDSAGSDSQPSEDDSARADHDARSEPDDTQ